MPTLKICLLIFCISFFISTGTAQVFYEKDFMYADSSYKIQIEKIGTNFNVVVSRLGTTQKFNLLDLNTNGIFHAKLSLALDSLEIKRQKSFDDLLSDVSILNSIQQIIGAAPLTDTDKRHIKTWAKAFSKVRGFHPYIFRDTLQNALNTTYTSNSAWIERNIIDATEVLNLDFNHRKKSNLVSLSNSLLAEANIANTKKAPTPKAGQLFVPKKAIIFKLKRGKIGIIDSTQAKIKQKRAITDKRKKRFKDKFISEDSIIIDSIVIEFQYSAIQNIKVVGKINGIKRIFDNRIPISYSKKGDVIQLADDNYLYTGLRDGYYYSLKLKNVLFLNNYSLHLFTENYAPKNHIISLKPGDTGTTILKERTGKLLSTRIYTDLVGINENSSNGLVQTEVDFTIPLNTTYSPFSYRIGEKRGEYTYIGGFNFIKPQFVLSKIENKNRKLFLTGIQADSELTNYLTNTYPQHSFSPTDTTKDSYYIKDSILYYASYLDVLKHQGMSIGFDLNALVFGFPSVHSRFYLNFGLHVNLLETRRTETTFDTISKQKVITNVDDIAAALQIYPAFVWEASPDSRLQLLLSYKPILYNVFNGYNFIATYHKRKIEKGDYSGFNRESIVLIHQIEGLVTYRVASSNTIFGRFRYNFTGGNSNEHFWQVQLGFSFDLNIKAKK